jgi:nucleoid-associated protein YgaU
VPAPAPTPASEPAATVAAIPPAIDAIEIDAGRNFFAGSGPDGATVRLYVDDTYVGSATVEGGRWLIETDKDVLTKNQQMVRIDVLKPGSSEVASRAEVRFVVDLPQNEAPPVAVAQNDAPAEPAPPAQPAIPAPAENPSTPQPAPEAAPSPAAPAQNAAPPVAATPSEPAPAVVPDDADVPTMVAEPVGDPGAQRFASGKAIIRHGDNLWTIARRVYGRGIKYTTIYTANSDQIRDPDLIYPGQVFDLPEDQR